MIYFLAGWAWPYKRLGNKPMNQFVFVARNVV
jgi:hypothetical protein